MDPPTLAELHALLARRDDGPRGLLGVDPAAPPTEIVRAYQALVARIHPANFPTDVERHRAASDLLTAAQVAYRTLRAAPRPPRTLAEGSGTHPTIARPKA